MQLIHRRTLVAGIIGVVLVVGFPSAARAEVPVSQVGWWTRSPTPPAVPDGGISVGAAPDGALTVGAVLVDAGDGASGASLRLVPASGSAGAEVAGIQVCPTSAAWSPAEGESLEDAPKDECAATSVPMTRGEDGTWTADVQKLLDGETGDVGLIVLPAADAVAFQLSFAPPMVDGSVSEGGASTQTETTTAANTAPSMSSSPSFAAPSAPAFVAPVPPSEAAVPALQETFEPAGGSSATAEAVEFTPQLGGVPGGGGGGSHVTKATVLLWYVLAMVVGVAVAGIAWLKNEGRLSPAALLARTRR